MVDLVVLKLTHAIELAVDTNWDEPFGVGTCAIDWAIIACCVDVDVSLGPDLKIGSILDLCKHQQTNK